MYALTEHNIRPIKLKLGITNELDTSNHPLNANEYNNSSSVGREFEAFVAFKSLEIRKLKFDILFFKFLIFLFFSKCEYFCEVNEKRLHFK